MTSSYYSYTNSLPKKRMSAGALFYNSDGKVLLVKPTYRDKWLIPGGIVEKDESPRQACEREIKEELSLVVSVSRILCIDYIPSSEKSIEGLHFIFAGGLLNQEHIDVIALQECELSEFTFVKPSTALTMVTPGLADMLKAIFTMELDITTVYLENGKRIEGKLNNNISAINI